jgi:hypothetical protein
MTSKRITQEAIYLAKTMAYLQYMKDKKMIQCDNQSAISLTKSPTQIARIKHINIQWRNTTNEQYSDFCGSHIEA